MTVPSNLEFAFPLTVISQPGSKASAWRVVGTPYVEGTNNETELDVSLVSGQDYLTTSSDGNGSVGQYVVFVDNRSVSELIASIGFDPFPVAEMANGSLYWELQPGSDVMATTIDGLGPLAITDENAGGVIGDIAYVVSGYVYNTADLDFMDVMLAYDEKYRGILTDGEYAFAVDDMFILPGNTPEQVWRCTVAGTLVVSSAEGNSSPDAFAWEVAYGFGLNQFSYWPYLERYDLAAKTWLPRVQLPFLTEAIPSISPAVQVAPAGEPLAGTVGSPFEGCVFVDTGWEISTDYLDTIVPPPDPSAGVSSYEIVALGAALEDVLSSGSPEVLLAYVNSGTNGSAVQASGTGRVWAVSSNVSAEVPPLDGWQGEVPAVPATYYAAEGHFAGVIDGKLYFGGGDGDDITGSEFFVYDPATQEFERLDEAENTRGWYSDYCAYGVAGGKIWIYLGNGDGPAEGIVFDPIADTWSEFSLVSGDFPADQLQGIEIDGKLYFSYDRVYVFDPTALTVDALNNEYYNGTEASWVSGQKLGQLGFFGVNDIKTMEYDPATDEWAITDSLGARDTEYPVAVIYQNVPYILSGMKNADDSTNLTGVYGLTGNQPVIEGEPPMTEPDPQNHLNPTATESRFSGLYPDNAYPLVEGQPDLEQQKRLQARQESDRTPRVSSDDPYADHPPFTERGPAASVILDAVNPLVPAYNTTTHVLTTPTKAHIKYYNITDPEDVVLLPAGTSTLTVATTVEARPDEGYRIPETTTKQWSYTVV